MLSIANLPDDMRVEVTDIRSAEQFLTAMHTAGLDYHFDDGAVDCLYGNDLVDLECAKFIDAKVADCYAAWKASGADLQHDCPIGFLLNLMDKSQ